MESVLTTALQVLILMEETVSLVQINVEPVDHHQLIVLHVPTIFSLTKEIVFQAVHLKLSKSKNTVLIVMHLAMAVLKTPSHVLLVKQDTIILVEDVLAHVLINTILIMLSNPVDHVMHSVKFAVVQGNANYVKTLPETQLNNVTMTVVLIV